MKTLEKYVSHVEHIWNTKDLTEPFMLGFRGEVAHWKCPCGQPNAEEREECLQCGKTPKVKKYLKKEPSDGLRGRRKRIYY